jgi:hypothetical protein
MEGMDSLFRRIRENQELQAIERATCEEHDVCVEIDDKIDKADIIILKVDDYYNSLNIEKRPKSPDCLILQRCLGGQYKLTIAELKDSKDTTYVTEVSEKFKTCLEDFMAIRFKDLLYRDYQELKLYLVSKVELYKRDLGPRMEVLISKRFEFRGKKYLIQPFMPNPAIKPCY